METIDFNMQNKTRNKNEIHYRIDDTLNNMNQLNLSSEHNESPISNNLNYKEALESQFGSDLISYFKKYYSPFLKGKRFY